MLRSEPCCSFKPAGYSQWRVHTAVCTILDTGCRSDEILGARVRDFDLDNLLLTVVGKGDKQRIVPFTFELRKLLTRFSQLKGKAGIVAEFMFSARDGGRWQQRNALRSYYLLLGRQVREAVVTCPETQAHPTRPDVDRRAEGSDRKNRRQRGLRNGIVTPFEPSLLQRFPKLHPIGEFRDRTENFSSVSHRAPRGLGA